MVHGTDDHVEVPLRRSRDFQLLWTGAALSQFGSILSMTAYPLLVLSLTGSPAWAGAVGAANQLPNLLVQLPAGVVADRWNRKATMIVCDAIRSAAVGSIAVLILIGRLQVWYLLLVAFIEGTCTVVYRLAEVGAIRNVVPQSQYAVALSANQARTFGAAFLGRPAAGFLFQAARGWPFAVDAITYAASLVTVALTRGSFEAARPPQTGIRRRFWRDAVEGLRWLWMRPYLRAVNFMVPVATLVLQALPLVVIVIAYERGVSAGGIGLILLGFSIGGLTGSLAAGWLRRRLTLRSVVLGSPWVWAGCCALAAAFPVPVVLLATMAGVGFANATWNVVVDTYQLTLIPDELIGRVSASTRLLAQGAAAVGPIAAGVLLAQVGGVRGMWVMATIVAALAVGALLSRTLRAGPTQTGVGSERND